MEIVIDRFLDKIFNHTEILWFNIFLGVLLIVVGGFFFIKQSSTKGKKTAGLFSLVIGCLTILSSVIQLFAPLF